MRLLVHKTTGAILDASNVGNWQVPTFAQVVGRPGDAETYVWPHPIGPAGCRLVGGAIVANDDVPLPRAKVSTDDLLAALERRSVITREDVEAEKSASIARSRA